MNNMILDYLFGLIVLNILLATGLFFLFFYVKYLFHKQEDVVYGIMRDWDNEIIMRKCYSANRAQDNVEKI